MTSWPSFGYVDAAGYAKQKNKETKKTKIKKELQVDEADCEPRG